ncbi:putative biosynthetic protein (TIGR04099 family) [Pseudomonas sp. SJZ080]|uniref:Pnap_2097 family protein n=1 Tax=Pseudomonas sp. SJZ080 TaxID=2572888 RepID=UPI00119BA599|nr:Pnap_2097 family protein [Pseudomonas sp. SJZ080]TWC59911.1 putative biosynthetic protein (TIGR04099 family) [Pseudomonas sp. SJZ080]
MPTTTAFIASRSETYLASMPNLAYTGLSENWLLKECGHQHWLALAQLHNRPLPDFVDEQGRIAYAAFTAVKLWNLKLETIIENRSFQINTRIGRGGHARHYSEHEVRLGDRIVGHVGLLSTFVSRHVPGDNRSVSKACLSGTPAPVSEPPTVLNELHADNRRIRSGDWHSHHGIDRHSIEGARVFDFTPCPDIDFNGADLLYFANFQAVVERAEWALLGLRRPGHIRQRELHFYGNLNISDSLQIKLHTGQPGYRDLHWCEVYRRSDLFKLADIFTRKIHLSDCSRP